MKKGLAMLLAVCMLIGCLAGCGKSEETSQEQTVVSETTEETKKEETKAEPEPEKEPVTVKWVYPGQLSEDDEMVMAEVNKLLKEKINVQLEFIAIESGEYEQRTQLMINAGEEFDLIYTAPGVADFYTNVNKEGFMPLNDLLETEAGKTLSAVLPEWIYDGCTINGNIYAVPNLNTFSRTNGVFIQKDLAEKYNLDVDSIKVIQDLEPFMEQIRDNEPDLIPIQESGRMSSTVIDQTPLDRTTTCIFNYFHDPYTTVSYNESEVCKAQQKLINDYYHKGFIRSDFLTVTDNSPELKANKYAICVGVYSPGAEVSHSQTYGKEYIGIQITEPFIPSNAVIAGGMHAINVNSKNAEAAIELLALLYTDAEVYNTLIFGLEGTHYTKVSDTRIELVEESGYSRINQTAMFGDPRNAYVYGDQADDYWTARLDYEGVQSSPLSGFVVDTSAVQSEIAQMGAVWSEYTIQLRTEDDFDAIWAEFSEAMEVAGADKVVEEINNQIAAWREANGK